MAVKFSSDDVHFFRMGFGTIIGPFVSYDYNILESNRKFVNRLVGMQRPMEQVIANPSRTA